MSANNAGYLDKQAQEWAREECEKNPLPSKEPVKRMSIFEATMIAEGVDEAESEEQLIEAWQHLIDTGTCWQLQGFFGRTAMALIEDGICQPADHPLGEVG